MRRTGSSHTLRTAPVYVWYQHPAPLVKVRFLLAARDLQPYPGLVASPAERDLCRQAGGPHHPQEEFELPLDHTTTESRHAGVCSCASLASTRCASTELGQFAVRSFEPSEIPLLRETPIHQINGNFQTPFSSS
jgi:hypothetical protein